MIKNTLSVLLLLLVNYSFSQQLSNNKKWQKTIKELQQQLPYFETNLSCQSCQDQQWIRKYTISKTILSGNFGATKPSITITKLKNVTTTYEALVLTDDKNNTFTISFVSDIIENADATAEDYTFGFAETKQAKKLEMTFAKLIAVKERFRKNNNSKSHEKEK